MSQTTLSTLTDRQISSLRDAAAISGDLAMVRDCDRALGGSQAARKRCLKAITDGEAMDD